MGMRIHKVFGRLSDNDLNELMSFFNEPEVLELINKYGDIDHPSIVFGKLMTRAKSKKLLGVFKVMLRMIRG